MLKVDHVSVAYGKLRAVWDVSLSVDSGEIVTLIGANGAGKTSLLNSISGLIPARKGAVYLGEQNIVGQKAHRLAKLGVGYVTEGRGIFSSLSVLDNLSLGAYSRHNGWTTLLGDVSWFMRRKDIRDRVDYVYGLFPRLAQRQRQKAGSLSGGEQQMLAIGRCLMASPKVMLLDEPSLGLAPNVVMEIFGLLKRLRAEGMAILLVEQDAAASLRIADRGYVIEMGRIVFEGTASYLINQDKVKQAYLGQVWRGDHQTPAQEEAES
ncbi:MAG: ABC transporter ATP-binding protein [Dehalococcoidia bacterium]|nr:ABC transporter ATP-binding protein [Dehalococcoidia bacterium]